MKTIIALCILTAACGGAIEPEPTHSHTEEHNMIVGRGDPSEQAPSGEGESLYVTIGEDGGVEGVSVLDASPSPFLPVVDAGGWINK